jgi:hypothetical protein
MQESEWNQVENEMNWNYNEKFGRSLSYWYVLTEYGIKDL